MLKKCIELWVQRWVMCSRRNWIMVLMVSSLSALGALEYVRGHLGINTNTADMISRQLDWRQRDIKFNEEFPQFNNTIVVVVDADTPDLAFSAAKNLGHALSTDPTLFKSVRHPGGSAFFDRHALLYLNQDALVKLADDLSAAQPLLERLNRDPSLYAVAQLLNEALNAKAEFKSDALDQFATEFAKAIEAQLSGRYFQLSWQQLMNLRDSDKRSFRELLIVTPRLNFSELFPVSQALDVIRAQSKRLSLDSDHGIRVRITGGLAMSDEELRSVSSGAGQAAIAALIGVTFVLVLGLGSLRLVFSCLVTLLIGLIWTASFAAAAVGQLNMISIAFAVLYIGLGVDYAIHYGLRYRELRMNSVTHDQALSQAAGDVGAALALCALTTGLGFFAFVPTDFAGVSELGLIAGTGMFISLAATLTLMPALLTLVHYNVQGPGGIQLPGGRGMGVWLFQHQSKVLAGFIVLTVAACAVLPMSRFDIDPLNLRDADGQAVSTYRELVKDNNRWSLDVLLPNQDVLAAARSKLEALPAISDTRALDDFVPKYQQQKLNLIDDLALLMGPSGVTDKQPSDINASAKALDKLNTVLSESKQKSPGLERLSEALNKLQPTVSSVISMSKAASQPSTIVLSAIQTSVLAALPEQLRRLHAGLEADIITTQQIPDSIRRDWLTDKGRLRLQINSNQDLNDPRNLEDFVQQVRTISPNAVGTPIIHLEASRVVVGAFQQAFALALACVAVLLWIILRQFLQVLVVLIPLSMAGVFSVALMVLFDIPFNFANVIALPLLLGIGVDSGIHMLSRARMGEPAEKLMSSVTARAVLVSALTTTLSFGNLAFSAHPGTASMGLLLAIGIAATLICTLVVLPALMWRFGSNAGLSREYK